MLRNIIKKIHRFVVQPKPISLHKASYSWSRNFFFSARPLNLSFFKIEPAEVLNPTPIIILHGFLGSKQNWRGLGKAIALKSGRQVYILDARNHGDSPHSDDFSYALMCEDVKHFMNTEVISSAVLVGHSMGGRTAMKLALTEKHMVNRLVVVDVSPIKMPKSSSVFIPAYMVAMKEAIASVQNVGIVQARKAVNEYLAKSIPEVDIRHFLLTNLVEKDKKIQWKANIDVLQKTFLSEVCNFSKFNGYYLEETLFICGGESPYVKEEDQPLIKEIFPKAEFINVAGAGHWVHSEKPSEFLEALSLQIFSEHCLNMFLVLYPSRSLICREMAHQVHLEADLFVD